MNLPEPVASGRPGPADRGRLTQWAPGGGCSCKLAPGLLEGLLGRLGQAHGDGAAGLAGRPGDPGAMPAQAFELLSGTEDGDDAAVVRIAGDRAVVATTDFFPPVVDDPCHWGRIAAANALSDVYAMGGRPVVAINLLAWPADRLDTDLALEVLRGGRAVVEAAGCLLAGGHSIADDTPLYGLAVTGMADPQRLLRNDAAVAGDPISLTKPLGVGLLNNRHKVTGEWFEEAVDTMEALNDQAAGQALAAGVRAVTDVTGFGLLGHLFKMARASGVQAVVHARAVPYLEGARPALAAGYIPGGTRRNLEWVRPHLAATVDEAELLLLADAQTSGGLLVAGELPGVPVIGRFAPLPASGGPTLVVR